MPSLQDAFRSVYGELARVLRPGGRLVIGELKNAPDRRPVGLILARYFVCAGRGAAPRVVPPMSPA